MKNLISLYYDSISNKTFEGIKLIREYFSEDGNLSAFRKLRPINVSLQEKIIMINSNKELLKSLNESEYIDNGYISSNGDRYIFLDLDESVTILNTDFQCVTKLGNSQNITTINVFLINKNLAKYEDDSKFIYACYRIAQTYFVKALADINSPIYISAKKYNCTDMFDITKHKKGYSLNDKIFYVNYIITLITLLDVFFDFKFSDSDMVKESIFSKKYWLNDDIFKKIFEYAINKNPEDEDYIQIFKDIKEFSDNSPIGYR